MKRPAMTDTENDQGDLKSHQQKMTPVVIFKQQMMG